MRLLEVKIFKRPLPFSIFLKYNSKLTPLTSDSHSVTVIQRRQKKFGTSTEIRRNLYSCVVEKSLASGVSVWYGSAKAYGKSPRGATIQYTCLPPAGTAALRC